MNPLVRIVIFLFILADGFLVGKILLAGKNVQLLNPQGFIAMQERDLFILAILIMLIGVIPAFILAFYVATKYHVTNKKATYNPEWENPKIQAAVWIFLSVIIASLC